MAFNWQVTAQLEASIEGVDAYARGRIVEIGINNNGVFGAHATEPVGYHDNRIDSGNGFGFIANPLDDDWVDYDGDFFTPGSPEEGFAIDIDGVVYNNNNSGGLNDVPGAITSAEIILGDCTPSFAEIAWSGAIGGLSIDKTFRVTETKLFIQMNTTITNTTDAPINNIFWMHNIDPDNNQTIGGSYTTDQEIIEQASSISDNICNVTATQTPWGAGPPADLDGSSVSFYAEDYRARVSFGGFSNRVPKDVWYGLSGLVTTEGATNTADEAMSIAFKLGSIAPGESKTFEYYYFTVDLDTAGGIGLGVAATGDNPTECDLDDGVIVVSGLIPGTIYNVNFDIDGVPAEAPLAGDYMANAAGQVVITGLGVGTYENIVLTYSDCVIEPEDIVVLINPGVPSAGGDAVISLCEGDASAQDMYATLSGMPDTGGTWTDDDVTGVDISDPTNVDFSGLEDGEYHFTYTQTDGDCSSEATITVTLNLVPIVEAVSNLHQCDTGGTMLFDLNANTATVIGSQTDVVVSYYFSMADADTATDPLVSPYENVTNPQTIYVRIENSLHTDCYSTSSFTLSSALTPVAVDNTEFHCSNTTLSHDLTADTTLSGNTYSWVSTDNVDISGETTSGTDAMITDLLVNTSTTMQDVVYTVTPTSADGCVGDSYTVTVTVYADPEMNLLADLPTCDLGENLGVFNLTDNLSDVLVDPLDTATFYTSLADAETATDVITDLTEYDSTTAIIYIRVEDATTGCLSFGEFNILVENCEPVIPNTFTPNGDGDNDEFTIHKLKGVYEDFKLTIYNRWGNIVYEGGNDDAFWDGKVDGFISDDPNGATYFYVLELNDDEHEPKEGWIYVKP